MRHVSRIKIAAVLVVFALFFATMQVFAAEVHVDSKSQKIKAGEQFEAGIFLNTGEEYINAVEGKILFPNDLLELKEIRGGNSIINFWIEKPKIGADKIFFSGIVPGGFQGKNGLILSAIFKAKAEGSGTIEFQGAKALKNDGAGTPAEVKISNFQFLISKQISISQIPQPEIKDIEKPESFVPEIAKDELLFEGKWFLVFATQDKASGIDRYEVKESRQRFFSVFKNWVSTDSPYVLNDQELRSYVYIKAIDKAGNERVVKINPRNPLGWYENYENWIIIIIGVAIAMFIAKKLWRKKRT